MHCQRAHAVGAADRADTCYHEAAHAVVAASVKGSVSHIEIGLRTFAGLTVGGRCAWTCTKDTRWDDICAIFAAGYVSDVMRGTAPEDAYRQAEGDRIDLRTYLEEKHGIYLSETGRGLRFQLGISRAEELLKAPNANAAWNTLGKALLDRAGNGSASMLGVEIQKLLEPILTPADGAP